MKVCEVVKESGSVIVFEKCKWYLWEVCEEILLKTDKKI